MAKKINRQEKPVTTSMTVEMYEFSFSTIQNRIMLGIIFVFSLLLYLNTFNHNYALDDKLAFYNNQFVLKGVSGIPEILKSDFFTGFHGTETNIVEGGRYRPLSLVSFALEYEMYGLNPGRSHIINALCYGILGMLLFIVLAKLLATFPYKKWYFSLPFITTLLFIANPLHTEVVANIKGRDEIFSMGFSLLTMLFTIRWLEIKKPYLLFLCFISFFLAMLSKENAAAFVIIIPVGIYFFKQYDLRKVVIAVIPIIGAFLLYLIIRNEIFTEIREIKTLPQLMNNSFIEMNGLQKYATIFFTLGLYLKLLLFPHPLTYDYYPYHIQIMEWNNPAVLLSFLIFLAIFAITTYYLFFILIEFVKGLFVPKSESKSKLPVRGVPNHRPVYVYGLIILVITLLPTSNLLFPIGAFMNERFLFVGLLGFCMILAYFLIYKFSQIVKKSGTHFPIAISIISVILIAWSYKTIDRNKAWKDNLTLFSTDIKTCPNSAKGNSSLGSEYLDLADKSTDVKKTEYIKTALPYFYKAIEIHPRYIEPLIRIGKAYYDLEQNNDSLFHYFIKVLAIDPNNKDVHKNLNGFFSNFEDPDMKKITPNRDINKLSYEIYYNLGVHFGKFLKRPDEAIKFFNEALKYNSNDYSTYKLLGIVYGMKGETKKSVDALLKAIQINPGDAACYLNLSVSYSHLGDTKNARFYYQKAVSLNPSLLQQ